jgi:hypothetical protein
MPKTDIDYSNTIIYKITCIDNSITDLYVGHTTNFVQRKHAHKQSCINKKLSSYKCKLYEVIRNNGGWNNWKMEIINFFNCKDHYEARQKEQEYFVSLNANLNSIEPLPKLKPIIEKKIIKEKLIENPIIEENENKIINKKFYCELCDYNCCKQSDWDKHLLTTKHQKITNLEPKDLEHFFCKNCNKKYTARNSLWYHEKKCLVTPINKQENISIGNISDLKELFKLQFNDNKEFKNMIMEQSKMMMEICKEKSFSNNINNITHTNSHNKSFNLNFFLNETCKDAMNLSDFINSLNIQLTDLESVGKLGFVDGISNIIIKNLEALEVEKRPIHCCDAKRETMYIKDQDKWEKEDNELKRMKELVRTVRDKNISMVNTWRDLYPECVKSDSKKTTQFNEIYMEAFGGEKGTKQEKEEKIISKIAKSVVIDKSE